MPKGFKSDLEANIMRAHDVLYFEICQQYVSINALHDKMFNLYGELCEQLKFKIYKLPRV